MSLRNWSIINFLQQEITNEKSQGICYKVWCSDIKTPSELLKSAVQPNKRATHFGVATQGLRSIDPYSEFRERNQQSFFN